MANIQAVLVDLCGTLAYTPVSSYVSAKQRMAVVVGCDPDRFQETWRSLSALSTLEHYVSAISELLYVVRTIMQWVSGAHVVC